MPTNEGAIEVAVYYDTENERDFVEKVMKEDQPSKDLRVYDGVVEGWLSKSKRSVLREKGLLFDPLHSPPPAEETEEAATDIPQPRALPADAEDIAPPSLLSDSGPSEPARRSNRRAALQYDLSTRFSSSLKRQLDRLEEKANSQAAKNIKSKARRYTRRAQTRDADSFRAMPRSLDSLEPDAGPPDPPDIAGGDSEVFPIAPSPAPEPLEDVYEVKLAGPMRPEWQDALKEKGLETCSFAPPNAYRMFLTDSQVQVARSLPFVTGVERYSLQQTVTPDLLQALESAEQAGGTTEPDATRAVPAELMSSTEPTPAPAPPQIFEVVCHRPRDLQKVINIIVEEGGEILDHSDDTVRFKASVDSSLLAALADLSEVKKIAPYQPPSLFANYCRALIGIGVVADNGTHHYTGAGETVAVFDSGIDRNHPDLADRVKEAISFRGAPENDRIGHGTHVAGIIAGTGVASEDDRICGVAPGAELVVVGMVNDDGKLELPVDLGELLNEAVSRGAKIINLSWGTPIGGSYDQGSASVDKFAYENPEVLVVVAAGNSGIAPEGTAKFNNIGTPASAKNVITIGASATDRPGIVKNTWGKLRPSLFQQPPMSDLPTAGNPDVPAATSSRGPTDFDSVKPDLLAPGTFVLSTRASHFAANLAWDEYPKHDNSYVYIGGSSMAAPMVTGAAAVLREYLRTALNTPNPSAALLKAMLIASAKRLPALAPELDEVVGYPDFDQGYGRLDLRNVLPYAEAPASRKFVFADVANRSPEALQSRMPLGAERKSSRTYTVKVSANSTAPLTAVLTWTDWPGNGVMNNLQLDVRGPGGFATVGNPQHRFRKDPRFDDASAEGLAFDKRNNVEMVRIDPKVEGLPAGTYRIRVIAQNTPFPPQGYALCVCGELDSDLVVE